VITTTNNNTQASTRDDLDVFLPSPSTHSTGQTRTPELQRFTHRWMVSGESVLEVRVRFKYISNDNSLCYKKSFFCSHIIVPNPTQTVIVLSATLKNDLPNLNHPTQPQPSPPSALLNTQMNEIKSIKKGHFFASLQSHQTQHTHLPKTPPPKS
jgi:hypothetical protein